MEPSLNRLIDEIDTHERAARRQAMQGVLIMLATWPRHDLREIYNLIGALLVELDKQHDRGDL